MQCGLILRSLFATLNVLAFGFATAAAESAWPIQLHNPQPSDGDFVLPMPCDGAIVFRKVSVPATTPLDDYMFERGGGDPERAYSENRHEAYISGGFSDDDGRYFYIAKYELNQIQYASVMEDECQTPRPPMRFPQTEVGWFDAMRFVDSYNQWLLEEQPDALPKADGAAGFLRLPTEAEWEFAARGGIKVSEAELRDRTFPMDGELNEYVWYDHPGSANGKLQVIGLTKPNPLGLHDILGNADEIALEPFKLNRGRRLHGHSGGFVIRGGSIRTPLEDIRSSHREEVPFYTESGPRRSSMTGIRLVLNAQALASLKRVQEVRAAWEELGVDTVSPGAAASSGSDQSAQPLDALTTMRDESEDQALKDQLNDLAEAVRDSNIERDEERGRAAKATLRLGAFLCRMIHNDGGVVESGEKFYELNKCETDQADASCPARKRRLEANQSALSSNLEYYADTIVTGALDFGEDVLDTQSQVLSQEVTARGKPEISDWADIYKRQLLRFAQTGRINRDGWLAECKRGV